MKINTVNIIEYADDDLLGLTSFSEDQKGNQEAEAHFKSVIKEYDSKVTEEELETFVEDGYYEQGTYQAFLYHSA